MSRWLRCRMWLITSMVLVAVLVAALPSMAGPGSGGGQEPPAPKAAAPASNPEVDSSSPEEQAESETAYSDLGATAALEVVKEELPDVMSRQPPHVLDLNGAERLEAFVDEFTAVVDIPGSAADAVVQSATPLLAAGDDDRLSPVDLRLEQVRGGAFAPRNSPVEVTFPADSSGAIELPGSEIALLPGVEGASEARVVEDKLFYANVLPDTDLLVLPRPDGVETFDILRSTASPELLTYSFELPDGAKIVPMAVPGVEDPPSVPYRIVDAQDSTIAVVQAPTAHDADNDPVLVESSVAGKELRLRVAHRDTEVTYPIEVDPYVVEDWRQNTNQPFSQWAQSATNSRYVRTATTSPNALKITAPSGAGYGQNSFGQWYYQAPAFNTQTGRGAEAPYIFKADFGPYTHSPSAQVASCVNIGIYSFANGNWEAGQVRRGAGVNDPISAGAFLGTPTNSNLPPNNQEACKAETNAYRVFCLQTPCDKGGGADGNPAHGPDGIIPGTPGNAAMFMLRGAGGGLSNSAATATLNGSLLFLTDKAAPQLSVVSPPQFNWVGNYAGSFSAADYGLGLREITMRATARDQPIGGTWLDQSVSLCTRLTGSDMPMDPGGNRFNRCPRQPTNPLGWNASQAPEGLSDMTFTATDIIERKSTQNYVLSVDRSDPAADASGPLLASQGVEPGPSYQLQVTANDQYSGVQRVVVRVPANGHSDSVVFCSGNGVPCPTAPGPHTFTVPTQGLGYGEYPVLIDVYDSVGRMLTIQRTIKTADVNPPTIRATGGLSRPVSSGRDLDVDASDTGTGPAYVKLWITPDGQPEGSPTLQKLDCNGVSPCALPHYELPADQPIGVYRVHVQAADRANPANVADKRWTFIVLDTERADRSRLGLEQYFDYDQTAAGGDTNVYVNAETGNAVWHGTPIVNPGRGLSLAVNLTYNSLDRGGVLGQLLGSSPLIDADPTTSPEERLTGDLLGASYAEVGVGFSLGISGPNRLNEPLGGVMLAQAVEENNPGLVGLTTLPTATGLQIKLTDADGTLHVFRKQSDGSWKAPAGFNMRLRRFSSGGSYTQLVEKKWALTRPDGVTFFYDNFGFLRTIKDRNDNLIQYEYETYNAFGGPSPCTESIGTQLAEPLFTMLEGGSKLCALRVDEVFDPALRPLTVSYREASPLTSLLEPITPLYPAGLTGVIGGRAGRIDSITDVKGREYEFTYDDDIGQPNAANGRGYLVEFTEAAQSDERRITKFAFEDPTSNLALNEKRLLRFVIEDRTPDGEPNRETEIEYEARTPGPVNPVAPDPPRRVTDVVKRNGGPKTYSYEPFIVRERVHADEGPGLPARELESRHVLDALGRPVNITRIDRETNGAISDTSTVTHLDWDADNHVCGITRGIAVGNEPGDNDCVREEGDSGEAREEFEYDLSSKNTGVLLKKTQFPTWPDRNGGRATQFGYDFTDGLDVSAPGADAGKSFVADLKSITRPRSSTGWTLDPDPKGNVLSITDANGESRVMTYGFGGVLTQETDERGRVTKYPEADYHDTGQPRTVILPSGDRPITKPRKWTYTYDAVGNVLKVTDPRAFEFAARAGSYVTEMVYDAFDRATVEFRPKLTDVDPEQRETTARVWDYDRNGNLLRTVDGEQNQTTFKYDDDDQVIEIHEPSGALQNVNDFNEASPATQTAVTRFVYDEADRMIAELRPRSNGITTPSAVRADQQLTCNADVAAVRSYVTHYCLDDAGRPVAEIQYASDRNASDGTVGDSRITAYAYDRRDNLLGVIDPARTSGATVQQAITGAGDPTQRRVAMTYNAVDERIRMEERPTAEDQDDETGSDARPIVQVFGYDANGNQTTVNQPHAGQDRITETLYDHRDQPIGTVNAEDELTCATRYVDGAIASITTPRGTGGNRATCAAATGENNPYSTFTTKYTLNPVNEVTDRTIPYSPNQYGRTQVATWKVAYTRNAVGDPVSITDARGNTFSNSFYDTGELRSTGRPSWWSADWGPAAGEPAAGERFTGGEDADTLVPLGGPRLSEARGTGNTGQLPALPEGLGETDLGAVAPEPLEGLLPPAAETTFEYDDEMRLTSVKAADGTERSIEYFPNGAVRHKQWPFKQDDPIVHRFAYDVDGNLLRSRVVDGSDCCTTEFEYDGYGWLKQRIAPGATETPEQFVTGDEVTQYEYDPSGNVLSRVTPRGEDFAFEYRYDTLDRLITEANPAGETWTYRYDDASRRKSELSPRGTELADSPVAVDLFSTYFTYDDADRTVTTTNRVLRGGNTDVLQTSFAYDDDGNRTEVVSPGTGSDVERKVATAYDGRGLPWMTTLNPDGPAAEVRRTVTEYDANGNLRRTVKPIAVNANGPLVIDKQDDQDEFNLEDATKNATIRHYDTDNQLVKLRLPWNDSDRRHFVQEFKREGNPGDPNPMKRVSSILSPYQVPYRTPQGNPGFTEQDNAPLLVGNSRASRTEYDYYSSGWIKRVSDKKVTRTQGQPELSRQVSYDYDHRGNQTVWDAAKNGDATNSPGRQILRTYHPNGLLAKRVAKRTFAADEPASRRRYDYFYNANRSLVRFVEETPGGRATVIARDAAERQLRVNELGKSGQDTLFDYDANGNVTRRQTDGALPAGASGLINAGIMLEGENVKTSTFAFDSLDRETEAIVNGEVDDVARPQRVYESRWFPSGQLQSQTRPGGGRTLWSYNSRGLVTRRERLNQTGGHDNATDDVTTYTYDVNDNRTKDERGTYAFNPRDQMVLWTRPSSARNKPNHVTTYDLRGDGSLSAQTEVNGSGEQTERVQYCYIRAGCNFGGSTESRGNGDRLWSSQINRKPAGSSTTTTTMVDYEYDQLGSLTRVKQRSPGSPPPAPPAIDPDEAPQVCIDRLTEPASAGETLYCYDEFERQVYAKGAGIDKPAQIVYDGLDRRDKRIPFTATGPETAQDYSYVGTSENVSREIKGGEKRASYDYNSTGDRLGQDRVNSTGAATYRAFVKDANGSVIALENDGQVATGDRYDYNPYGALDNETGDDTDLSASAKENPFRFQGFYYDSGVKTYDMHARAYRPEIARFLSEDLFASASGDQTLQSDPLTQNRYAFGGGNPVTNIEFDGHVTAPPDGNNRDEHVDSLRQATAQRSGADPDSVPPSAPAPLGPPSPPSPPTTTVEPIAQPAPAPANPFFLADGSIEPDEGPGVGDKVLGAAYGLIGSPKIVPCQTGDLAGTCVFGSRLSVFDDNAVDQTLAVTPLRGCSIGNICARGASLLRSAADSIFSRTAANAGAPRYVYRGGSNSADNLTPRPQDKTGLSTFDNLEAAVPPGGKAQVIDTTRLKCLIACPDAPPVGHVSIRPTNPFDLQGWMAARGTGTTHPYSQELQDAIVDVVRRPK